MPFIGLNNADVLPFVGNKIPLIRNQGFSIIELIIVLTIAGILVSLAVPGIQKLVASNRLTSQVNDLMADINLIRSESIKRNTNSGICTSTTGTSCAASGNWADGWLVYYVCPSTDTSCIAGTNVVVKTHEAMSGSNTLSASRIDASTSTSSAVDTVTYSKSGSFSTVAYKYKFTVCDPKRKLSRIIDITVVGQTSVSSGTC